jgi:hypothetical protein
VHRGNAMLAEQREERIALMGTVTLHKIIATSQRRTAACHTPSQAPRALEPINNQKSPSTGNMRWLPWCALQRLPTPPWLPPEPAAVGEGGPGSLGGMRGPGGRHRALLQDGAPPGGPGDAPGPLQGLGRMLMERTAGC